MIAAVPGRFDTAFAPTNAVTKAKLRALVFSSQCGGHGVSLPRHRKSSLLDLRTIHGEIG
jgi:hypothetical protein